LNDIRDWLGFAIVLVSFVLDELRSPRPPVLKR
jgi:hypothetical protein